MAGQRFLLPWLHLCAAARPWRPGFARGGTQQRPWLHLLASWALAPPALGRGIVGMARVLVRACPASRGSLWPWHRSSCLFQSWRWCCGCSTAGSASSAELTVLPVLLAARAPPARPAAVIAHGGGSGGGIGEVGAGLPSPGPGSRERGRERFLRHEPTAPLLQQAGVPRPQPGRFLVLGGGPAAPAAASAPHCAQAEGVRPAWVRGSPLWAR